MPWFNVANMAPERLSQSMRDIATQTSELPAQQQAAGPLSDFTPLGSYAEDFGPRPIGSTKKKTGVK